MLNILTLLENKVREALRLSFGQEIQPEITQSTQPQFGDYQCNNPLKLSKELRASPREIAQKLVQNFDKGEMISKIEIAGPGFINITLDPNFISQQINEMLHDNHLGVSFPKHP